MGMTKLSKNKKTEIVKEYIGKVIIFCEGETEKYYLDYFADIINNKNKYADVRVETECASGNAKRVLNFTNEYLEKEENNRKYAHFKKYLVFDCDAPKNIQNVITDMLDSDKGYSLLISNYLFEVWFLMHFENVDTKLSKLKIYERLSFHLTHEYKKGNEGIIREIISKGSIAEAIGNARELMDKYRNSGKTIETDIKEMNPYTNFHILIEQFLLEIS